MRKNEIKSSSNEELIIEFANTFSNWKINYNYNCNRGTVAYWKHMVDLLKELVDRGLVSQEAADKFLAF